MSASPVSASPVSASPVPASHSLASPYRRTLLSAAPMLAIAAALLVLPARGSAAADGSAAALAARGAYVARAADCMSCHTAPGGRMFAGGDELKTVFGSIYGPNITPDTRTGIGTWTKEDFTRALRLGVRKDGNLLYPAMPYVDYTKMTDGDLDALWAYMRTVPAVEHAVPPAEKTFRFPFNIRAGNAAWQALFFKPARWQPAAGRTDAWNRGNYLVTVLGHCGECHSPKNIAKAQEFKYHLTGGQLEGWYAPDIANDPLSRVTGFTVEQLAHFLKTGNLPDNTTAFGPMQETVHDSLRYLSAADLRAIAVYLKEQPPPESQTTATSSASVSPASLAAGRELYLDQCSACHQPDGRGIPHNVPALAGNTAVTAAEPNDVVMAILEGFGPNGTWGAMGSFASSLTDQQVADIANYVRTAWGNHAQPNAVAWSVGNWRHMADVPQKPREPALICPLLKADVMQPALRLAPDALRAAAHDPAELTRLVRSYTDARPASTPGEIVEAMSTAYCRAVVSEHVSEAQSGAKIATFSQDVALALADRRGRTASNSR